MVRNKSLHLAVVLLYGMSRVLGQKFTDIPSCASSCASNENNCYEDLSCLCSEGIDGYGTALKGSNLLTCSRPGSEYKNRGSCTFTEQVRLADAILAACEAFDPLLEVSRQIGDTYESYLTIDVPKKEETRSYVWLVGEKLEKPRSSTTKPPTTTSKQISSSTGTTRTTDKPEDILDPKTTNPTTPNDSKPSYTPSASPNTVTVTQQVPTSSAPRITGDASIPKNYTTIDNDEFTKKLAPPFKVVAVVLPILSAILIGIFFLVCWVIYRRLHSKSKDSPPFSRWLFACCGRRLPKAGHYELDSGMAVHPRMDAPSASGFLCFGRKRKVKTHRSWSFKELDANGHPVVNRTGVYEMGGDGRRPVYEMGEGTRSRAELSSENSVVGIGLTAEEEKREMERRDVERCLPGYSEVVGDGTDRRGGARDGTSI